MALFGGDSHSMRNLYRQGLCDAMQVERQISRALPRMAEAARSPALRQMFADHRAEAERHAARLREVFVLTGTAPRGAASPAIEGFLGETRALACDIACPDLMDAALAAAAQAMRHYEISRYRTLVAWSRALGEDRAARILSLTLAEEIAADGRLSRLAEARLNHAA